MQAKDQVSVYSPSAELLRRATGPADETVIDDREYLRLFGVSDGRVTAGELWSHLVDEAVAAGTLDEPTFGPDLRLILDQAPSPAACSAS